MFDIGFSRLLEGTATVSFVLLAVVWSACETEMRTGGTAVQEEETAASTIRSCSGPSPDYEAELKLKRLEGHFRILNNGFPVEELPFMGTAADQSVTADLNTALVGEGNELTVEVMPFLTRGDKKLDIGTVEMRASVNCNDTTLADVEIAEAKVDSTYKAWSERARKQWKKYLEWERKWLEKHPDSSSTITARDGGALDSMRQWTARHRLSVSTTFDNEAGPDFSRIFEEAPRLPDRPATRKRLKDYAMHLRDLMARKDTAGLVQEFLPVVWTGMDSLDTANLRSNFSEKQIRSVREHIVMENAYLDITRSEIGLRRWAEGRVWELYYEPDGKALFGARTFRKGTPEYTGSGRKREVYVAELGEELKVVR